MAVGRFITLEGGEGVGKSTQAKALEAFLKNLGYDVVVTREPGGTPDAEAIRTLLMTGSEGRWNAETEALLFAAARADHVAKLIRPALDRGTWVICDRFVDSTRAYQGGGGNLSDDDILTLHSIGSGGLLPDRTFLLHLSAETGAARAAARDTGGSDRMGSKPVDYYARVSKAFETIADKEPERFRMIEADAPVEMVTQRLIAALKDLL